MTSARITLQEEGRTAVSLALMEQREDIADLIISVEETDANNPDVTVSAVEYTFYPDVTVSVVEYIFYYLSVEKRANALGA